MKIQILGSGCPKCRQLGMVADFEKITDSDQIVEMGVMITPALAIDGSVKRSGNVLSVDEVAAILRSARA